MRPGDLHSCRCSLPSPGAAPRVTDRVTMPGVTGFTPSGDLRRHTRADS